MHCVDIGDCNENAQSTMVYRVTVFAYQKFISSKIVVHILFAIKGVFPERFGTYAIRYSPQTA